MAVHAEGVPRPIPRPEPPQYQVRPVRFGKEGKTKNAVRLADPVPCAHVIIPLVGTISEFSRLIGGKITALTFSQFVEAPLIFV